MSRHLVDRVRHLLPLPPETRARQPFVIDTRTMRIIAPWPEKRPLLGDEARMDAMLQRLKLGALPAAVCWCWPDRPPEPVTGSGEGWLAAGPRSSGLQARGVTEAGVKLQ
jgi:hypothetical protein